MSKKKLLLLVALLVLLVGVASAGDVSDDTTVNDAESVQDAPTIDNTISSVTTEIADNNKVIKNVNDNEINYQENDDVAVSKDTTTIPDTTSKNMKTENSDDAVVALNKNDDRNTKAAPNEHTFSELQNIINAASSGSEIELQYDYLLTASDTTLRINKPLTINGNNHILNGMGRKRILLANYSGGTSLTLKNIKFIDGGGRDFNNEYKDDVGGAVFYNITGQSNPNNIPDLIIINCTFEDNGVTDAGGAVYATGGVQIKDSHFFYNEVEQGNGGAVYAGGGSTVLNSIFEDNCVRHGVSGNLIPNIGSITDIVNYYHLSGTSGSIPSTGGAIFSKGLTKINDSVFKKNQVGEKNELGCGGGAVHSIAAINMSNCNFTGNIAYDQHGGAVLCNVHAHIYNCNFKDNIANVGGAVSSFQNFDAHNSTFQNNGNQVGTTWIEEQSLDEAISISTGLVPVIGDLLGAIDSLFGALGIELGVGSTNSNSTGGAIYARGSSCTIDDCIFDRNHASEYGGAIYAENKTTVRNSNFTSNTASRAASEMSLLAINLVKRDGGAIHSQMSLDIKNCNFNGNKAKYEGGTIYCAQDCNISNSTFSNSNAAVNGGAVYAKTMGKISKSTFISNSVTRDSGDGGAIYIEGTCNPEFILCEFTGNNAGNVGGAIFIGSSDSILKVSNSTFTQNVVQIDAGAIYSNGQTKISNSTFKSNIANGEGTARSFGGAIRSRGNMTLDNSDFESNSAYNFGGAIYADQKITITKSNFTSNTAKEGGAVYAGIINDEVTYSIFRQNKAYSGDGGAVYLFTKCWPKFNYCVFDDNIAIINSSVEFSQGGAIYGDKTGTQLKVSNSNFTDNKARHGGAIYVSEITGVTNSVFLNNVGNLKSGDGAAIYIIDECTPDIVDCRFENNICGDKGGAVFVASIYSVLRIYNSSFTNNSASEGGAVYTSQLYNYTSMCNFTNNKATAGSGGAIYINRSCQTEFMYSHFVSNSATQKGGAIYFDSTTSKAKVTMCNYFSNVAHHGGAMYVALFVGAYNSVFLKNTASPTTTGDGGALFINISCNPEIVDCRFEDNACGDRGGAVYLDSSSSVLRVYNSSFTNNSASRGGAVYAHKLTEYLSMCVFTKNVAKNGHGGAVYVDGATKCELWGSTFTENSCTGNGGAVYFDDKDSSTKVTSCNFFNNTASGSGGAVYVQGKVTGISDSVFLYNNATSGDGGAVYIGSKSPELETVKCRYENNHAYKRGGAIYTQTAGTELTVWYCTFVDNKADQIGYSGTSAYRSPGHDIFNSGHYNYIRLNWFGINNPDFTGRLAEYVAGFDDKDLVPSDYLKIGMELQDSDNLIAGNPYKVYILFSGTATGWSPDFNTYPLHHSTGEFRADGRFYDVHADLNDMSATVVFNSGAKQIMGRLDHQILYLDVDPIDKDPCTVEILSCEDVQYPDDLKVTYSISPIAMGSYPLYEIKNSQGRIVKSGGITSPDTLIVEGLKHGNYSITISTSETSTHLSGSDTATFNVYRSNITVRQFYIMDRTYPQEVDSGYLALNSGKNIDFDLTAGDLSTIIHVGETGRAFFNLGVLPAGYYRAVMSFEGDDYYNPISLETTFNVHPSNTTLELEANPSEITYGESAAVTHKLPENATGTIKYYLNGTFLDELNVTDNIALPLLDVGSYEILGNYSGDNNHKPVNNTTVFMVKKASNNVAVNTSNVTYGNKTLIKVTADIDGVYKLDINGTIYNITVENGIGNKTVKLDAGKYYANVTFDNKNYDTKSKNTTFEVYKANTNINILANTTTYPQVVKGIINSNANGKFNLTAGNKSITVSVNNGTDEFNFGVMDAGTYAVIAKYSGDKNYKAASKNITVTVKQGTNNANVSVANVTYGKKATIIVSAKVDGTYQVDINKTIKNVTVKNGKGNISLALDAGNYYANVTFNNKNYNTTTKNTTFKVNKADTNIKIIANNTTYPQEVNGIINASADGKYNISIGDFTGNVVVKDGSGKFNTGTINAGDYQIVVKYPGDKNHNLATITLPVKVDKMITVMDIESNNINVGQTEKVTVKLPVNATGNVTLTLENKNYTTKVKDGQAVISIPNLTAGDKNAKVYYTGDTNHNPTTGTASFKVSPVNVVMDIESIDIDVGQTESVMVNLPITVTVKDSNGKALTGNVTFKINGTTIKTVTLTKGVANATTTINSSGTYLVTATYNGNANYTKATVNQTVKLNSVSKISTVLSIAANNTAPRVNDKVKLTVTLKDASNNALANQNVTLKIGNKSYALTTDRNGNANANYTINKTDRVINVTATFKANGNYLASNNSINITRRYKADMELLTGSFDTKPGDTVKLIAHIQDNHVDIDGGQLVFKLNGLSLKDENGSAVIVKIRNGLAILEYKIPDTLGARTHNLTAVYASNDYGRVELTTPMTIGKYTTHIDVNPLYTTNDKILIRAQIVDQNNQALNKETVISIKLNGKSYTLNTINGTINYQINTTLKDGYYNVTIKSGENGKYLGATANTVLIKSATEIKINYINNTLNNNTSSKSGDIKTGSIMSILTGASTVKPGDRLKLIAHLSEDQIDISGGQLVFKLNGVSLKDENDSAVVVNIRDGLGILDYKIPDTLGARTHNLTAVYSSAKYGRVDLSTDLTMNRLNTHIEIDPLFTTTSTAYIKASILDDNNQKINKETSVVIKIDGKSYSFTNSNGTINFKVPTNITKGIHQITIIAGENGKYISSRKNTVLIRT